MKLIFSKDMDKLPLHPLPKNAVMIGKPSKGLTSDFAKPVIITFALSIIAVESLCFLRGREYDAPLYVTIIAVAIFFLMVPLHELMHIVALEKKTLRETTIILAKGLIGVYFPNPIKKERYVFVSILPNILLAILPLIVWMLYPEDNTFSKILIHYIFFSIVAGAGDYRNVLMVLKYVPKGAMIQNDLKDSYWFKEGDRYNAE